MTKPQRADPPSQVVGSRSAEEKVRIVMAAAALASGELGALLEDPREVPPRSFNMRDLVQTTTCERCGRLTPLSRLRAVPSQIEGRDLLVSCAADGKPLRPGPYPPSRVR